MLRLAAQSCFSLALLLTCDPAIRPALDPDASVLAANPSATAEACDTQIEVRCESMDRTLNHHAGVVMAEYLAEVTWTRNGAAFTDNRYSRAHTWSFDGGAVVPGSSSPHSVRIPMSDPAAVDPEEALVAAASSCHMLYFLALAARAGLVVDSYADAAIGIMEEIGDGRKGITRIHLRPRVTFSGDQRPTDTAIAHLHHESHDRCYIANTLKAEILTEGSWTHAA